MAVDLFKYGNNGFGLNNFDQNNTPTNMYTPTSMDAPTNPSLNFNVNGSNLPSFETNAVNPPPGSNFGLGDLFKNLGGLEGLSKFGSMIGGIMTAMNGQDYMNLMKDQYNTSKASTNIGLDNQRRIADTTNDIQGYLRGGTQGLTGDALKAFTEQYKQQHALSNAKV
jgi:hypothetical protein